MGSAYNINLFTGDITLDLIFVEGTIIIKVTNQCINYIADLGNIFMLPFDQYFISSGNQFAFWKGSGYLVDVSVFHPQKFGEGDVFKGDGLFYQWLHRLVTGLYRLKLVRGQLVLYYF